MTKSKLKFNNQIANIIGTALLVSIIILVVLGFSSLI